MKKTLLNVFVLLLALAICPAANSQKKGDKKAAKVIAKDVPTLSYKFTEGKTIKYVNTSKVLQTMDINGQSMDVNVNGIVACTVKSKGNKDGNIVLEVRIDSIAQFVDSPNGSAGGPVADVKGKIFDMVLSPSGKELDLSGAKQIVINVDGAGQTDASQSFSDFFPDVPTGTIAPGFTWTTNDTIKSKSTSNSMVLSVNANHKFEGFETVNGINCAKISSVIEGTRVQNTETQGMTLVITGPYTGTTTVYFAVDEGYLLKQTVTTKLNGNIDITSQGMSFPIVMDVTSVNEAR
jgi:hypothetical protein